VFLREYDSEAFAGLGTPVAYLVDEHGIVAEPVALGATDVVNLARRVASEGRATAAGPDAGRLTVDEHEDHQTDDQVDHGELTRLPDGRT
jgi:hypothetical protein